MCRQILRLARKQREDGLRDFLREMGNSTGLAQRRSIDQRDVSVHQFPKGHFIAMVGESSQQ